MGILKNNPVEKINPGNIREDSVVGLEILLFRVNVGQYNGVGSKRSGHEI